MHEQLHQTTGGGVKKFIAYSVLAFVAWLAITTGWALVSYATGVTGPAAVTSGALGIGANVAGSVDVPFPFSKAQDVSVRQLRRSQHFVERVNEVPERVVHRFLDRFGIHHAHAHEVYTVGDAPEHAPHLRHLERIRVRSPRISVVMPNQERVTVEVADAVEEVREALAAELSAAQSELMAARIEIEAWEQGTVREDVMREIQTLDLDRLKLEIDAELEALSEELQRLELDMNFELHSAEVDAGHADLERFRLEIDATRHRQAAPAPADDEAAN